MGITDRIRTLAEKDRISFNALEKKVGLGKSVIYRWNENTPSADKLKMVEDYFGVTMDYLLTVEEKEPQAVDPQAAQFDRLFQRLSAEGRLTIIQKMLELSEKE